MQCCKNASLSWQIQFYTMSGDSSSNVELANFGQELNRSYENVLNRDSSPHRSKFTNLKAICNTVLVFGLIVVIIYLLSKPNDDSNPLTKQLINVINVTETKLLYQMNQKSQNEERITNQMINVLLEMKQSMEKTSSMFFRMVRPTQRKNSNETNEIHFEANNFTELQLDIGDISQCFKKGICIEGHLVDVIKTENVSSCMELCQFDEQCQWASFDLEFKFCTLFRDCPEIDIDKTRSKCITSKVNCPLEVPCNVTGRCDVSVSLKLLRLNTYIVHIEIYQSRVLSGHYE